MKDAIPVDRSLFKIDPKAYLCGADVAALVHTAGRAPKEHNVTVVFISLILEARAVVDSVEYILACVPHLDPIHPGRGITDILPEAPAEAGVRMVMLNHAEHPITFIVLEKAMQRATEIGLATVVCVSSLVEARAVASLGLGLLVAKSMELIGTGKPPGLDYAEALSRAVREINLGARVLQGAGIPTPADVEVVIRNGADVTGSSSAIAAAPDPSAMVEAMIRTARHGWDAHPRS